MNYDSAYNKKLNILAAQRLRRIKAIYEKTAENLTKDIWHYRMSRLDNYRGTYYFRRNRLLYRQVTETLHGMTDEIVNEIESGVKDGWRLIDEKNNLTARQYRGLIDVPTKAYLNTDALNSFMDRRYGQSPISKNIWQHAKVGRDAIDNYLGSGILEGRGAAKIARLNGDLRNALMEPNRLFRRVRDSKGNLVLSSAAKKYHPGRGVYRSSYKNAFRYARNEIRTAQAYADYERRISAPYVTGIRVKRGSSLFECSVCDANVGDYPKEFIFTPWHVSGICYSTSILMSREELRDYLRNGVVPESKMVRTLPKGHVDWVAKNRDKLVKYQGKTAWLKDNYTQKITVRKDLNLGETLKGVSDVLE